MTRNKYNKQIAKKDSDIVDSQCTLDTSNTTPAKECKNDATDNEAVANMTILDTSMFENNFSITRLTNDTNFADTTNDENIDNVTHVKECHDMKENIVTSMQDMQLFADDKNEKDDGDAIGESSVIEKQLADMQCDSNTSFVAEHATSDYDANDTVYLSNIYNMMKSLNNKMDTLHTKDVIQESFMYHYKNIYKYILLNNTKDAKEYMRAICKESVVDESLYDSINNVKEVVKQITKRVCDMQELTQTLKDKYSDAMQKCSKHDAFVHKLQKILQQDKMDQLRQMLVSGIKQHMQQKSDDVQNTGHNDFVNDSLVTVESGSDIALQSTISKSDLRAILKQVRLLAEQSSSYVREENIQLQESNNALTKANIKLKKDCALLANELSKQKENNKKRQNMIDKQKKIINVLQQKFDKEDNNTTMNVIERKIADLKCEIENESDYKKRCDKISELVDLEKRLHDFMRIAK